MFAGSLDVYCRCCINFYRYHDRATDDRCCPAAVADPSAVKTTDDRLRVDESPTGTDALIEVAVKTGLNLIFGLLHQNLCFERQLGSRTGSNICNNVLQTALDIVMTFEPLSLAEKRRLPSLAVSSLADVTLFLRSVVSPQSCADPDGRRLAAELILAVAAQRGSLRYLLEWIEMSLFAAATVDRDTSSGEDERQPRTISSATFLAVLSQMKKAMVSVSVSSAIFSMLISVLALE